jgi:hypothetical protein
MLYMRSRVKLAYVRMNLYFCFGFSIETVYVRTYTVVVPVFDRANVEQASALVGEVSLFRLNGSVGIFARALNNNYQSPLARYR